MVHCEPQVLAIGRIQHDLEVLWTDIFPLRFELQVRASRPDMEVSVLTLEFYRVAKRLAFR